MGILATFDGAHPTILAGFALVSLGMVLSALVAMYWRDPAFLTFSSREALDIRILQEIRGQLPPELLASYIDSIRLGSIRGLSGGSARSTMWTIEEIGDLDGD